MLRLAALALCFAVPSFATPAVPVHDAEFAGTVAKIASEAKGLAADFFAASHWMQDREVVALLRDQDPQVRVAALKYARSMPLIQDVDVRREVGAMASNERVLDVRLEAVRTLYWVAQYNDFQRQLFDLARHDAQPRVRAMAYKALHSAAAHSSSVWRYMLYAARNEKNLEVQQAVAWSLFECSGQPDVRRELERTAWNAGLDAGLRLEAVKSLYGAMVYSEISRGMIRLAYDVGQPKDLRLAAILALSAVTGSEVSRAIEGLLRDPDPGIRAAAVQAAGGLSEELRRFFHLGYKLNDRYVSPIENE